jgi:hypothetical protein
MNAEDSGSPAKDIKTIPENESLLADNAKDSTDGVIETIPENESLLADNAKDSTDGKNVLYV